MAARTDFHGHRASTIKLLCTSICTTDLLHASPGCAGTPPRCKDEKSSSRRPPKSGRSIRMLPRRMAFGRDTVVEDANGTLKPIVMLSSYRVDTHRQNQPHTCTWRITWPARPISAIAALYSDLHSKVLRSSPRPLIRNFVLRAPEIVPSILRFSPPPPSKCCVLFFCIHYIHKNIHTLSSHRPFIWRWLYILCPSTSTLLILPCAPTLGIALF